MSGTSATYHATKEELRKEESKLAGRHGGNPPSDADTSQMKVHTTQRTLPQPPTNYISSP